MNTIIKQTLNSSCPKMRYSIYLMSFVLFVIYCANQRPFIMDTVVANYFLQVHVSSHVSNVMDLTPEINMNSVEIENDPMRKLHRLRENLKDSHSKDKIELECKINEVLPELDKLSKRCNEVSKLDELKIHNRFLPRVKMKQSTSKMSRIPIRKEVQINATSYDLLILPVKKHGMTIIGIVGTEGIIEIASEEEKNIKEEREIESSHNDTNIFKNLKEGFNQRDLKEVVHNAEQSAPEAVRDEDVQNNSVVKDDQVESFEPGVEKNNDKIIQNMKEDNNIQKDFDLVKANDEHVASYKQNGDEALNDNSIEDTKKMDDCIPEISGNIESDQLSDEYNYKLSEDDSCKVDPMTTSMIIDNRASNVE